MNPPAGGDHFAAWLNCGIYDQPQENSNAVHALEHGAVWDTHEILSPYPGLPAPVVASAWGKQVQLDTVDDPRLAAFIEQYWQSPAAPEPGAPCVGAIDGPGKIG